MKKLSFGLAALGLIAFALGVKADDGWEVGLGVSALICAVTTYLSAGISSYLRVFAGIFSVETIVSGLLVTIIKAGLWPAAYAASRECCPTSTAIPARRCESFHK